MENQGCQLKFLDSFLEIAGNLGFLVGNNDRRREQARKENRLWGPEQDGFAVSIAASSVTPGPDDSLRVEVALRNTAPREQKIRVRGWLSFFRIAISQPDGSEAQPNTFGKRQMEAAQAVSERCVTLSPGEIVEADIPVSALFDLKQRGIYILVGSSRATRAISNRLEIRI